MSVTNYSQNNEQEVITNYFGNTIGRFLDIGAFTGKELSNTYRLVELGWSGVCVEPSPSVFVQLLKLHGQNPKIEIVNAAVGPLAKVAVFFDSCGEALSTTNPAHLEKWNKTKFQKYWIYVLPISELYSVFGTDFDFVSLDVESANWEVFCALQLEQLKKLRMLCVEHDGHDAQMTEVMSRHGFTQVSRNAENVIFVRT